MAHNNLFTEADLSEGTETAEALIEIVNEAMISMAQVEIPQEEKDALRTNLVALGLAPDIITEEKFLRELEVQENFFHSDGGYVGLSHFVNTHLARQEYDSNASLDLAYSLEEQGKVDIYRTEDFDSGYRVNAIKRKTTPMPNRPRRW